MERAFDALKETAEGEILEAAKAQVAQRSEKLLSAVYVGKFLQGAPQFSSCLVQHTHRRAAASSWILLEVWHGNRGHH